MQERHHGDPGTSMSPSPSFCPSRFDCWSESNDGADDEHSGSNTQANQRCKLRDRNRQRPGRDPAAGDKLPFSVHEDLQPPCREGLVERLKLRATEESLVNPRPKNGRKSIGTECIVGAVVNLARPNQITKDIKPPRIAPMQVCFRPTIASLLL